MSPKRNWKFSLADIEERKFWKQYMKAYEACLSATSTGDSPGTSFLPMTKPTQGSSSRTGNKNQFSSLLAIKADSWPGPRRNAPAGKEETHDLAGCAWTFGVRIGPGGVPPRPRMAAAMYGPILQEHCASAPGAGHGPMSSVQMWNSS